MRLSSTLHTSATAAPHMQKASFSFLQRIVPLMLFDDFAILQLK